MRFQSSRVRLCTDSAVQFTNLFRLFTRSAETPQTDKSLILNTHNRYSSTESVGRATHEQRESVKMYTVTVVMTMRPPASWSAGCSASCEKEKRFASPRASPVHWLPHSHSAVLDLYASGRRFGRVLEPDEGHVFSLRRVVDVSGGHNGGVMCRSVTCDGCQLMTDHPARDSRCDNGAHLSTDKTAPM